MNSGLEDDEDLPRFPLCLDTCPPVSEVSALAAFNIVDCLLMASSDRNETIALVYPTWCDLVN